MFTCMDFLCGLVLASQLQLVSWDHKVMVMTDFDIRFPMQIDPSRKGKIKEIRLFVSVDGGRTWQAAGVMSPDENGIPTTAPGPGLYWFAVQVVRKDGTPDPDVSELQPAQKVFFTDDPRNVPPWWGIPHGKRYSLNSPDFLAWGLL